MANRKKQHVLSLLKVTLPLLVGIYLLWHFYTAMDKQTKDVFFKAINEADYFWIILSVILGFISHLIRAYRWKYLLEPVGKVPKFWHRYHALMIGYFVNLLIPRAGEATRAAMLFRTDKIPFSRAFGTIIGERVLDLLMLGLLFLAALILNFDDLLSLKDILTDSTEEKNEEGGWVLTIFLSITMGAILIIALLWSKLGVVREKLTTFIKEVMDGVLSIFKSKHPGKFIFQTLLIWILYVVFFWICFFAFEATADFPIAGVLIGYIAGTLGLLFINGGIGAYPYLVGVVVTYYMGDLSGSEGIGKALGMIIWLSQTLLMILLGLISLIFIPRNFKKEKHDKMGEAKA